MNLSKKALLVIDMQKDLCYDEKRRDKVFLMLDPLKDLIDLFHQTQQPIYYISFALKEGDPQFKRFGDRYCIEGSEGAEIIPELLPLKGSIIIKRKHSAFFETNLHEELEKNGVTDVYLAGMQTQICIMTTAADANFRGYRPVAVEECVLSTREQKKQDALTWISSYVGEVQSMAEVKAEMGIQSV